jgi:GTP:adenosylcobinamide-phosphate guanylyltransferase
MLKLLGKAQIEEPEKPVVKLYGKALLTIARAQRASWMRWRKQEAAVSLARQRAVAQ